MDVRENGREETRCVIFALKKFTGGLGDDDDCDNEDEAVWQKYFTKVKVEVINKSTYQLCIS